MSKLIISILIVIMLSACTFDIQSTTRVECPCTVDEIQINKVDSVRYYIYVRSIKNSGHYFGFYTNIHHQLGDTIQ